MGKERRWAGRERGREREREKGGREEGRDKKGRGREERRNRFTDTLPGKKPKGRLGSVPYTSQYISSC